MKLKLEEFLPAILLFLFLTGCNHEVKSPVTCGIYGHPGEFWEKGYGLNELGINAVFVHSGSIDSALIDRAKSEGMKIYAEFATLNGKGYVETHPEAWAINNYGEKAEAASWFMGVCPTNREFREYRKEQLIALLNQFDLDGVWMDYVHWHAQFEEPEPILPETCFCPNCLETFRNFSGILIPEGNIPDQAAWILENHQTAWRDWRCSVIAGWARDIKSIVKKRNPDALLGLYHCPWNDEEFDGARRRILGLDYDSLRNIIDVFSPMVYHGRMGREPEWVLENINWFTSRLKISAGEYPKVWPIVQAYDDPHPISREEFAAVMRAGLSAPCSGVMMFTARSVAQDEGKIKVIKEIYN
ncbi:MAG TPA: hypothetical protein VI583_00065 [Cyclobacteriaceae bacterium]|nr:hypothetical protein [Cyclobacteriaceae bacterium]